MRVLVQLVARRYKHTASPHDVLGVPPDASRQQIKDAFRRLALRHHPDVPTGCLNRYQGIRSAFDSMLQTHDTSRSHQFADRPSWAASRRARADVCDTEEEEELAKEYEELRRRARSASQDAQTIARDRESMLRGLRLLCMYICIGGLVKYALLGCADHVRDCGWVDAYVHAAPSHATQCAPGGIKRYHEPCLEAPASEG